MKKCNYRESEVLLVSGSTVSHAGKLTQRVFSTYVHWRVKKWQCGL